MVGPWKSSVPCRRRRPAAGRRCGELPGGAGGQRGPSPGLRAGGEGGGGKRRGWPLPSPCLCERRRRAVWKPPPPAQASARTCLVGVTWWRREGAAGRRARPGPEACPGPLARLPPPRPPPPPPPPRRRGTGPRAARRRERRSHCLVEGREKVAAGPDLQARTAQRLSAGAKTFHKGRRGGGRIGPCGSCAPAPAPRGGRRRRGAAPRPTRRPAGPEDARGAAEEGGRVARGRASAGAAWRGAVCVPARPRGAVCPPRPRLIMSVVLGGTTPPHPKFMTAEPQTAQGWESCTSSEVELKLR